MGIRTPISAADALFTPGTQRVLGLLYGQPERAFLGSEVIRLAGSGTGATHRVLKRLAASGIARTEREGRQVYYQANADSPIYEELRGIVRKLIGIDAVLREALAHLPGIESAFIYGSTASGSARADSDIDVMVIGETDYGSVYEALTKAEASLGRRIDPTILTPSDWRKRRAEGDGLARRVSEGTRLFVIGDADE